MEHTLALFILSAGLGFIMACAVGANDVANAMGTSVGSKVLTLKQAIILAAIFESLGACLASGQVTNTLRGGLIHSELFQGHLDWLLMGMLSALMASSIWLVIATAFGWPVSTTHTIVGAILGFSAIVFGVEYVQWKMIAQVVLSWVVTPMIAMFIAAGVFYTSDRIVFQQSKPKQSIHSMGAFYVFWVTALISVISLQYGLPTLGCYVSMAKVFWISLGLASLCALVSVYFIKRLIQKSQYKASDHFKGLERIFSLLTIFTACAMAFAHGSNDVANAIAPLVEINAILTHGANYQQAQIIPFWIIGMGAIGVSLGLGLYGYRVMETVGSKITHLTPSRGFSAQLATATTVIIASAIGFPVSTTQVLVGAILGVGLARGIESIDLTVVKSIAISWVITLPAGALLSVLSYYLLRIIFH
ncbi:inorganic phosphate transporter [Gammaproteobacteria bacterium]|nr:inorganic phosphate transporter [Gammaproteobacteria bacterium]